MLAMLAYILWDVRPEIFGPDFILQVRWYGLLFALGFLIGQWIVARIFKIEGKPERDLEWLMIYMVVATIIGARLGHCFFYEPEYFLENPIEILYIWKGGLASHGAAIGILIALFLYSRKRPDQSFLWVVDRIVIVVALGGCFIRFGNLINSEIEGKPSDLPFAFVFAHSLDEALDNSPNVRLVRSEKEFADRPDTVVNGVTLTPIHVELTFEKGSLSEEEAAQYVQTRVPDLIARSSLLHKHYRLPDNKLEIIQTDTEDRMPQVSFYVYGVPRHPAQLYESLSSLLIFLILLGIYWRYKSRTPEGLLFGLFLIMIFTLRFFYEFIKENQVEFENELTYNMGQILSIPAVIAGILVLVYALTRKKKNEIVERE